jgi:predicted  nucleic acid-binding Zn-ribbon protein
MPPRVSRDEWDRRAAAVGIEWVGDEPIYATKKRAARCLDCGARFMAYPSNVQQGNGCPLCGRQSAGVRRRVSREEWDRRGATVGIEWIGSDPVLASTKHAARCLACGHEWAPKPSHVRDGHRCPACAGYLLTREEWDRRAAAVGIEWVGDQPVTTPGNHAARCLDCGARFMAYPSNVQQGRKGCAICGRRRTSEARRTSLEEWDRRIAMVGAEWVGDEPVWSRKKRAVRCLTCGHEWDVLPGSVQQGHGCSPCGAKKRAIKFTNRYGATPEEWDRRARAAGIEWVGDPPTTRNAHALARCCTCGREYEASGMSVSVGAGCAACAGVMPITDEDWHRRANAVDIEWVGAPPFNAHTHAVARCQRCGHEYDAPGGSVRAGSGCPACALRGFDSGAPGTVYLIRHDLGPYMKVGITGADPMKRLNGWTDLGWDVLATWPIPIGRDAAAIERNVIEWWTESSATRCKRDELPEGLGWTEAVHITAAADEPRTLAYIEELVAEVGGGH